MQYRTISTIIDKDGDTHHIKSILNYKRDWNESMCREIISDIVRDYSRLIVSLIESGNDKTIYDETESIKINFRNENGFTVEITERG